MNKIITAMLLLVTFSLSGCYYYGGMMGGIVTGSGRVTTRNFDLSDFTQVDVGHAFQVDVSRADTFSVTITADDNIFDYLQVDKVGSTLRIGLDNRYRYTFGPNALKAQIKMPALDGLILSGATRGTLSGFESTRDLSINVSGASGLNGSIDAGNVTLDASGASTVTLQGSGKDSRLQASGASRLNLDQFAVDSADVNLSGASSATVNAKSKLGYDVSGASSLTYSGSPAIGRSQTSGASSARQR